MIPVNGASVDGRVTETKGDPWARSHRHLVANGASLEGRGHDGSCLQVRLSHHIRILRASQKVSIVLGKKKKVGSKQEDQQEKLIRAQECARLFKRHFLPRSWAEDKAHP